MNFQSFAVEAAHWKNIYIRSYFWGYVWRLILMQTRGRVFLPNLTLLPVEC